MVRYAGFPAEGIEFLRKLERNNRREWFQARKEQFETQVRAPMLEFAAALNRELAAFAPLYMREPKEALYRIYRDTRFSADKTPYKTHIAALFPRIGMPRSGASGLYVGISHKGVEVAGGVYVPSAEDLRKLRALLAERHEEFRALVRKPALKKLMGELQGERLTRAPKGWPSGHPAEDLLRAKQWYFGVELEAALATTPRLLPEVAARFRAMAPAVEFLNQAFVRKKAPALFA
ncbi:MAG TPA: TIGR02453 family protein [Solibacterales bacterium]|nr:TIGR02453 family protein [Bryobacterales bacterium]